MAVRFLEITLENAKRLGFYTEVPKEFRLSVTKWYVKTGETLSGREDENTGELFGDVVLEVDVSEGGKGIVEIEAQEWEIGSRIVRYVIDEGQEIRVNLYEKPLSLAELEVADSAPLKPVEPAVVPVKEGPSQPQKPFRATPVARRTAEEHNVSFEAVLRWLGVDDRRVEKEDVLRFVEHLRSTPEEKTLRAAPATRKLAQKLGIDLRAVAPSGAYGIVTENDVLSHTAPAPAVEESISSPAGLVRPTPLRAAIAKNLAEAWSSVPIAGDAVEMNAEPLMALYRNSRDLFAELHGTPLRLDHFFVAASAWLLARPEFTILNAKWIVHEESFNGPAIAFQDAVNVGIAVAIPPSATKSGYSELVTPVVRNADKRSFPEIAREANRVIGDALAGKPKMQDQAGPTFIANNVGAPIEWMGKRFPGGEIPNPVVPFGVTALAAFGAVRDTPQGKRMVVAFRFDHRICDGYEAIRFLRALQESLEHPETLLFLR